VVPAKEQPCRHHIQRLEVLLNSVKYLLKVRQHCPGELIDQKCAVRMQDRMRFLKNEFPDLGGYRGVGDT